MKTIERKTMLYKTGVEYGDYTINHIQGCAHGCKFPCYAMMMAKRFGKVKTYEEWCEPFLVENALEILDKEIPKLKDKIESVHLCFTSDPFMYGYKEISKLSLAIIKKLNSHGIKCTVLTKGILPIALSELSSENEYGITLVSIDEEFRKGAELALKKVLENGVELVILQSRSPSCSVKEVYDGSFSGKLIQGQGVFAKLLKENNIRSLDVSELDNLM